MDMDYTYGGEQELESLGLSGLDLMPNIGSFVIGIVGYVLLAIGMYAIAKRRGIKNPWLAWIPFGSTWMLGCISDQFRYVTKGEEKSKRKWMLAMEILTYALLIAGFVILIVAIVKMFAGMNASSELLLDDDAYLLEVLSPLLGSVGVMLLALIPAIALTVLQYMALYDLFSSCEPNNKVLYLLLSIFFSMVMPVFVFICRNKDLGMPPRQPEYYQPPVWQPPVQPQEPPVWQKQPPVEPWDNVTEE